MIHNFRQNHINASFSNQFPAYNTTLFLLYTSKYIIIQHTYMRYVLFLIQNGVQQGPNLYWQTIDRPIYPVITARLTCTPPCYACSMPTLAKKGKWTSWSREAFPPCSLFDMFNFNFLVPLSNLEWFYNNKSVSNVHGSRVNDSIFFRIFLVVIYQNWKYLMSSWYLPSFSW